MYERLARLHPRLSAVERVTQQEVAERMGTTKSVLSRIESGQHRTSTDTLRRLAEALDGRAVIGLESNAAHTALELVRL